MTRRLNAISSAIIIAASVAPLSNAMASQALATKAGCMMCHAVDKKLVGPAFKEVAAKYKGDSGAAAKLAATVRAGSKGVWGPAPMMPMDAAKISDADLDAVIGWILSQ